MALERKVVLVTRHTRLEELLVRHHTLAQARFYLEHLGADFGDYVQEQAAYARSLAQVVAVLQAWGRYQLLDRSHLPSFVFGADDIVVTLGQDGLVANTLKYLDGQPLIGLNPEPARWDGVLLPFEAGALAAPPREVAADRRDARAVTLAQARLSDGQVLRAVNDLFIGPRSHSSALYDIELDGRRESQSSSGVIVATGLGSTAWLRSIVTGSMAVVRGLGGPAPRAHRPLPWDSPLLTYAVREPFPSRRSATTMVYGQVAAGQALMLHSRMPDHGVIFSDGMEHDFLRFTAGMAARIDVAPVRGRLIV
jgi:NAD kinase